MKKERLIIDLNTCSMSKLDQLVEKTGAATRAEFIRNLLSFSEAAIDNIEKKNEILLKNKNGIISKSNFEYILMRKPATA